MNGILRVETLLLAVAVGLLIYAAFHFQNSFDSAALTRWFVDIA